MAILHIALQEGFTDDAVQITVNGRQVYNRQDITTRVQIGYADSLEVDVEGGSASVTIGVTSRNLAESIEVPMPHSRYLGVSLGLNGDINFLVSDEPFGYL